MKNVSKGKVKQRNRVRDFALYVLICFLVIATFAGVASTGIKWQMLFKGLQFFTFPVLLLGIWVPDHRADWNTTKFWLPIGLALLIHTVGFVLIAPHYETFKPIWTSIIAFLECVVFVVLKEWIGLVRRDHA